MTWTTLRRAAACALTLLVASCGLLDVSNPTAVETKDVANATAADMLRRGALSDLYGAVRVGAFESGLLADEILWAAPSATGYIDPTELVDRRESERYEATMDAGFSSMVAYHFWHRARRGASLALPRVRAYMPEPVSRAYVGQLFAARGFATLGLAEQICPGFPVAAFVDDQPAYSPPLTTDEAFERALADFDSAVGVAVDSVQMLNLARVGRGRALVGLGRFAEAAAAVAAVPVDYVWNAVGNGFVFAEVSGLDRGIADREGVTGLDFVAADDPRLPDTLLGTAVDGVTPIYGTAKYPDRDAPTVLASGVEARLIEAEAALHAGAGDGAWLTILNDLRATQVTPALPPLDDPGTSDAQVDLLFRERAFWLFGTGHRLGDLRRLIGRYGRASEAVFPTGPHRLGGRYGVATSIPFPAAAERVGNSAVTGCTTR